MRSVLSIDVANGKSEVLLITEHGEILIEPYEVKHCLNEFNQLKEKIESFLSFEEDIRNYVNKNFKHNFPIVKKFVNLINFVDFDSEERKDIQKLVSIIENKDDSFDQDKTISFTKCNKKSTIDNTPIDVLL